MNITKTMIDDLTKGCEGKVDHTFIQNGYEMVYITWYRNGKKIGVRETMEKSEWENKNK